MNDQQRNKVESETLRTFKAERPSEYFSHLDDDLAAFKAFDSQRENLYRFGLTFPPEFFNNKSLIDLGAGTGEATVSLARWGAICTLVEMNPDAVEVAKRVFSQHTNNFNQHSFINSSLYDLDLDLLKESFDISSSCGVFTHVADKAKAFAILASLAKPGGYVIYGDRNTLGGLQEMLQRYAIYQLGGQSDEKIVEIAEILFSEDIDRSQRSVARRTRRAIIFDRWVIQQQDDPSVNEVLTFFEQEGLEYVSSWPRIDFPGRGNSVLSDPRNLPALRDGARLIESLWMVLNKGESENILSCNPIQNNEKFYDQLEVIGESLRNHQINDRVDVGQLIDKFIHLGSSVTTNNAILSERLEQFSLEVQEFLKMIEASNDPQDIRKRIDSFKILFRGYAGVRHVDYVAFKPR